MQVGELQFDSANTESPIGLMQILIGVGIMVLVFGIILIVGLVKYRRQARESDRVQKRMQNQMDALEGKVAKECKEGKRERMGKCALSVFFYSCHNFVFQLCNL